MTWITPVTATAYLNFRWFTDTFSSGVVLSKIVSFGPSYGVYVMTSYSNACDVTIAN